MATSKQSDKSEKRADSGGSENCSDVELHADDSN
jgi:hypothetical protein